MEEKSLYNMALDTMLSAQFVAKANELNRDLTDEEVIEEAKYQLADIPFKGWNDDKLEVKAMRQMVELIKKGRK